MTGTSGDRHTMSAFSKDVSTREVCQLTIGFSKFPRPARRLFDWHTAKESVIVGHEAARANTDQHASVRGYITAPLTNRCPRPVSDQSRFLRRQYQREWSLGD